MVIMDFNNYEFITKEIIIMGIIIKVIVTKEIIIIKDIQVNSKSLNSFMDYLQIIVIIIKLLDFIL